MKAMAAMKLITSLTANVHRTIKVPAEKYVAAATPAVNTDDETDEISFPALGLKMNTVDGLANADGDEGPKSNTLAAWGGDVARERKKLEDEVKEETTGEMASFGNLEKVLSRNGIADPAAGMTRTKQKDMTQHKADVAAESEREMDDASALLAASTKTVGIVKEAVNDMVKMKKEDGAERLEAQSERQARAVDVEAASDANAAAWDALRAKVRAFNEKHQLGDFADKSRKSIEQIEREKAQTALDTEDDADTAEAREEREQAEAEAQKSNEEDRKDAQAKDEAEVVAGAEKSPVEKDLAKAKEETRSDEEKSATSDATTDVSRDVDNLESKEKAETKTEPDY